MWRAIITDLRGQQLTPDGRELEWLRSAARMADRCAEMEAALAEQELIVPDYNRQPTANPLIGEIQMHNQLISQTLNRIRTDVPESGGITVSGNRYRAAALARWNGA